MLIAAESWIPSKLYASPSDLEIVAIEVAMEHPIILITIYMPPNSSHEYYLGVFSYLKETLK